MKIFENDNIKIDLPLLIDSRALFCANSGGGKSYALRKILEETANDVMSIILDYEGEFKTLREKFDFLLIGPTGDVPININAAHLLPQKLMEFNISTIIDISDLKMNSRILYVKKFLEALIALPQKYWKPCLVIVDEAHNLCGQQEKQDSFEAVRDLMTRGRKRGFCGILSTQRISKLHKDAVAEANFYFVGRTSLDIDMNRAADILGFANKADKLSLRTLPPGTFYFFDPRSDHGIEKVKIAKTQTTHPKVGIDLRGKIIPPTEKIKAMLSKLNDLPKEAEEKARTLEDAKKRIRELERELKKLPAKIETPVISAKIEERARQRGIAEAERKYKTQLYIIEKNNQLLMRKLAQISQLAEITSVKPIEALKGIKRDITAPLSLVRPQARQPKAVSTAIEGDKTLGRCERSILSLLYNNPQRTFTIILIGVFTGYSNKSGGFKNAIAKLNALRLIQRGTKAIRISQEGESQGQELLGDDINLYETFTIDNWEKKLPLCASKIFSFLRRNLHDEFSREELGENTGYEPDSGGFKNSISQLNQLGLIVRNSGNIKLNNEILEL